MTLNGALPTTALGRGDKIVRTGNRSGISVSFYYGNRKRLTKDDRCEEKNNGSPVGEVDSGPLCKQLRVVARDASLAQLALNRHYTH
jgi:hypothetical protein